MKYLMIAFACAFMFACEDKDEDTGTDSAEAVEESGDSDSE